jgi:hypothetical protein
MKNTTVSDPPLFPQDPAAALEFLERSRDVADEVVVDGRSRETSPSRSEEVTAPRSGSSV